MSALELEKEIIEKFRQLTPENRARLLSTLRAEAASPLMPLASWLAEAEAVRFTVRADASGHILSAIELVNEAREERDADILHSSGLRDFAGDGSK
jgi:hypothetical protein